LDSIPPFGHTATDFPTHDIAARRKVVGMSTMMEVPSLPVTVEGSDVLRRAVARYLARYKGLSRSHTESDLRLFLRWCTERGLDPLAAQRPHIELYIRWMQEIHRFKPSTVSRRISIVAGFYRTCVIDQILASSPAQHVRRPNVPPESPTLGLIGLRIFEATGADITDLGEEHGHGVLKVHGKGDALCARASPTSGRARPRPGRGLAHRRSAATPPTVSTTRDR
jgi:hypothetical protein